MNPVWLLRQCACYEHRILAGKGRELIVLVQQPEVASSYGVPTHWHKFLVDELGIVKDQGRMSGMSL